MAKHKPNHKHMHKHKYTHKHKHIQTCIRTHAPTYKHAYAHTCKSNDIMPGDDRCDSSEQTLPWLLHQSAPYGRPIEKTSDRRPVP